VSDVETRRVAPCRRLRGVVRVPGDKSISHRAAMLSGLAAGRSEIRGFLASEDCLATLRAMESLGAVVTRRGERVDVNGTGGVLVRPAGVLDLGNSGTSMRLLAGIAAGQPFVTEMTGDASLCSRPMKRIQEPLERMGARVELTGPRGCAPIRVAGGRLRGIDYAMPVASAQVKSCILLAGLFAEGRTAVTEPKPTRDHTERMLRAAGVEVEVRGHTVAVSGAGGPPRLAARTWDVPGDFSSAAFWMGAAAARPGAEVVLENVGLNPRRTALLDVLRRMGARIEVSLSPGGADGEPAGTVRVTGAELRGTDVGGDEIPNLIDELPLLAAVGALAAGETRIRDAAELRVKESDRIATMAGNLRVLGADVEELPDGMVVRGAARICGGLEVGSFGDHRVAMAMAVLALFADAPVPIRDVACVATSYPTFWDDLERLAGR
jgi:3-phosphoshikimate 1-carboxyvinyltransferase